jgi:peptide/nickel transport system substrate-binding protein
MKRIVIFLMLAMLLVTGFAFAGGKKEAAETPTTAAPGEPQYGGTMTVWRKTQVDDPDTPDIAEGRSNFLFWLNPMQEMPLIGDIEKYGPRGNGEFAFQLNSYIPTKYQRGHLLESYELDYEKAIWHVRPGIYWQGRDVMESREFVAEDVVRDLLYYREAPGGKTFKSFTGKIYASDKYTVVIEMTSFDISIMYRVGYEDRAVISPPETEGSKIWDNQVGTGPWMFNEYVVGSYMKYDRNPNYWKTTMIDGKEYQLPFVDELLLPIIPDRSTQIAALRTGKLDFHHRVPASYWKDLRSTAPDLIGATPPGATGFIVVLNCSQPPFDNVDVRRALMVGTDLKAFADIQDCGPLPKQWFPVYTGDPGVYTPIEELPEDTKILYDYNPELAKKMLADAGYPNGFKMIYNVNSDPKFQDRAALAKNQWAKLGVEVEIKVADDVARSDMLSKKTYKDAICEDVQVGNPLNSLTRRGVSTDYWNWALWKNEKYDAIMAKAVKELDPEAQNKLMKEASHILMREVPIIATDPLAEGHFWWPWLKNYYGESNDGDNHKVVHILSYAWIDQDLKKKMGF